MLSSLLENLFPPLEETTPYLARGCLFGIFLPSVPTEEQKSYWYQKGTLQINQVVYLDVIIKSRVWLKLSQSPTFSLDNAYLWRVFFRTDEEGNLRFVELIRNIPLEGHLSLDNPPPPESGIDQFYIRGEVRYSDEKKVVLRVKRNQKPPKGQENNREWQSFLLTVSSGLPQASRDEFWDLCCIRKGGSLVLTYAHLISKTSFIKKPGLTLIKSTSKSSSQSNSNLSPNQVIMIPGKQPEITVKFNTRPDLPEVGKVVVLEITSEQGLSVRANLNRKTLKKQVEKMDTFTTWIAALSGKVARIDQGGVIELEAASVTVFEKKVKEEVVSEVQVETAVQKFREEATEKVMILSDEELEYLKSST